MANASRCWGQLFIQAAIPNQNPVILGSLWVDTTNNLLKRCTSLSPYTFVSVEGGGGGGGGGAPEDVSYLVLTSDPTLTNERVLTILKSIQYVDNGAGSTFEISLVGDEDSPGSNKYYGTDAGGTKGFHTLAVTASSNGYFPGGWV